MQKILLILVMMSLSGCASFGRGVAEALLDDQKEDTRQCEIQGTPLPGINDMFKQNKVVKVMMIHGVGTHTPGYATRIRENLAKSMGLNVFSRRDKNIVLIFIGMDFKNHILLPSREMLTADIVDVQLINDITIVLIAKIYVVTSPNGLSIAERFRLIDRIQNMIIITGPIDVFTR